MVGPWGFSSSGKEAEASNVRVPKGPWLLSAHVKTGPGTCVLADVQGPHKFRKDRV